MLQETPLRSVAAGVPGEGKRPHAARPFFFLSDLHLSEAIPHTVAAFEHFIRVTAEQADSVFILGDLFEYWIGDDMLVEPFVARMAALLHTLSERGIALYRNCQSALEQAELRVKQLLDPSAPESAVPFNPDTP